MVPPEAPAVEMPVSAFSTVRRSVLCAAEAVARNAAQYMGLSRFKVLKRCQKKCSAQVSFSRVREWDSVPKRATEKFRPSFGSVYLLLHTLVTPG